MNRYLPILLQNKVLLKWVSEWLLFNDKSAIFQLYALHMAHEKSIMMQQYVHE
jgi:hypothetical protein